MAESAVASLDRMTYSADWEDRLAQAVFALVEAATLARKAEGISDAAARQFMLALVSGLAERFDEIGGAVREAVKGRLH